MYNLCFRGIHFTSFYGCSIELWTFSARMVLFWFSIFSLPCAQDVVHVHVPKTNTYRVFSWTILTMTHGITNNNGEAKRRNYLPWMFARKYSRCNTIEEIYLRYASYILLFFVLFLLVSIFRWRYFIYRFNPATN